MAVRRLAWAAAFAAASAGPARAQEIDPYQMVAVFAGYGRIAPTEETGFRGGAADDDASLQLGVSLERRQQRSLLVYVRIDGDVADARQHLGGTVGVRAQLFDIGRFRPYLGGGAGVLWAEPRQRFASRIDGEFTLRGEAIAGVDWRAAEGIRWVAEYRLSGARLHAIGFEAGCPTEDDVRCLAATPGQVLHLGHAAWIGLRIMLF